MKKIILLAVVFTSSFAFGESIELSTGEVVDGKLMDFPKDVTIQLSDGSKKTIPYQGITSIFKNAQPQSYSPFLSKDKNSNDKGKKNKSLDKVEVESFEDLDAGKGPYASPAMTFQTWKKAAMADDIDGMVNCYVEPRRAEVKKELKKISKKTRAEMKLAMVQTLFTPSDPFYQGEFAIMEVSWAKGLASQTQTLKFTLENNKDWKIVE